MWNWLALIATLASPFSLLAKDLADYHLGDVAAADLTTFLPLDVPDAAATAAQRAAAMDETPSVFRDFSNAATNQLAVEFSTVMSVMHGKFKSALRKEFTDGTLMPETITSPEFTNFVSRFIAANQQFPVNFALATEWARGGDGATVTGNLLTRLLAMMQRPVCADQLPADFFPGENFYVLPVAHPKDALTLEDVKAHGRLVPTASLTKLSRLRMLFRRGFAKEEQSLAEALASFLRPDCAPDVELTDEFRSNAASRISVTEHYDAGQVIVAHGSVVDEKALAAITQLRQKIALAPPKPATTASPTPAPMATPAAIPTNKIPATPAPNYLGWAITGFAAIITFYIVLRAARPRRHPPLIIQAAAMTPKPVGFAEVLDKRLQVQPPASVNDILKTAPPNIAPQFVDALKEAVVTELATQRRDLLFAQQAAAAEIADLARRLETAQAPLLERLRAYEQRITELELELADQSKQNRELLQLKIEMLKQQIQSERGTRTANFN